MEKIRNLREMFYYKGYNKQIIKLVLLIIFSFIMEVTVFPYFMKRILDIEIPNANIKGVIIFSFFYIIALLFSCYIVLKFCILRLDLRRLIENDLREDIFKKLQNVKQSFYDKNTTGTVLQFLSNDSDDASNLFPRIIVEMCVMGIGRMSVISILLLFVDIKIGIGVILIYILGLVVINLSNKKTVNLLQQIRKINVKIFNIINEGITGFTTVKSLSIENEQIKKLENEINNFTILENKLNKIVSRYNALFEMICSFTTVWLLIQGILSMTQGLITYGILTIAIDWVNTIKGESRFVLRNFASFNKSYIAFFKIIEFLKNEEIEDLDYGDKIDSIKQIEFNNVNFQYNNSEKVIKNFNLKVNQKQQIALVGKTGSGKSTIVNMICRLYEPTTGEILINSKNIKQYNLRDLRSKIGYCMQDVVILKYTIIDNIRYVNPNITIEEIENIFKKLNLHNKIMNLKDNYETNIYDYPDLLSKGEKQLIAFARIMAMNPDIIILDEVTSQLSYSSEMLLKNAANQIIKDKICFIIAHRLSTIRKCDKILVMEKGEIIEQGTHEELIKKNGQYYKLVNKIS